MTTSELTHGSPTEEQWIPVNMWETDRALVLVAPMPGVTVDDVSVTLDNGLLRLAADLRTPAEKEYRIHEWLYGAYRRVVHVGRDFGEPATATLGNGLLAVSLARTAEPPDHVEVAPVAAGAGD